MVVYNTNKQEEPQGGRHDNPVGSGQAKGLPKEELAKLSQGQRRVQERIKNSVSPGAGLFTPTKGNISRIQQIEELRKENAYLRKKIREYEDNLR